MQPDVTPHRSASIAAIVVSWNTRDLLRDCLGALTKGDPEWLRVVCIDNASSDGSPDMVASQFPAVRLLRNSANVGFASAVNQGLARAAETYSPDFFALINSDVVVGASTLTMLASQLQRTPNAAAIAPALRHPDGHLQSGAAGFAPTAWSGVCHFLFLSALTRGWCRGVFINQHHFVGRNEPVSVDWVSGACAVVRAEVVRRVGDLDTSFFMYAEDVDWFVRMRRAGYSVWYVPSLECLHHQGGSAPQANPMWIRSLCELVRRERGSVEYVLFRLAAAVGFIMRRVLYSIAYYTTRNLRHRARAADMAAYARAAIGLNPGKPK